MQAVYLLRLEEVLKPFPQTKKTMKTTFTMIAAMVAFTAGAIAAPAVTTAPAKVGAVAESKTVTLEVTGLR